MGLLQCSAMQQSRFSRVPTQWGPRESVPQLSRGKEPQQNKLAAMWLNVGEPLSANPPGWGKEGQRRRSWAEVCWPGFLFLPRRP